jgi:hypothetical protein
MNIKQIRHVSDPVNAFRHRTCREDRQRSVFGAVNPDIAGQGLPAFDNQLLQCYTLPKACLASREPE